MHWVGADPSSPFITKENQTHPDSAVLYTAISTVGGQLPLGRWTTTVCYAVQQSPTELNCLNLALSESH